MGVCAAIVPLHNLGDMLVPLAHLLIATVPAAWHGRGAVGADGSPCAGRTATGALAMGYSHASARSYGDGLCYGSHARVINL